MKWTVLKFLIPATKLDIQKIMSAISDYTDQVNKSYDTISTAVDGIGADVTYLKDTIDKLQNSPGSITPADQTLLDNAQARVAALADRLTALDGLTTPPPPPPTP